MPAEYPRIALGYYTCGGGGDGGDDDGGRGGGNGRRGEKTEPTPTEHSLHAVGMACITGFS